MNSTTPYTGRPGDAFAPRGPWSVRTRDRFRSPGRRDGEPVGGFGVGHQHRLGPGGRRRPGRCGRDPGVVTWSGIVYVAVVVEVYFRAIVGWSAATSERAKLVLDALDMASRRRDRAGTPTGPGPVHHSDAGSQYTSFAFGAHLLEAGIDASIGTVGDARENALMERQIGFEKTELIKPRRHWHGLADVELATAEWGDWFDNQRLHTRSATSRPTSTRPTTVPDTGPNRRPIQVGPTGMELGLENGQLS
ncbi:DDE-type integrase/transposase/recombinase [Streptomyces sp. NPDC007991]|uniref:DDE-type integrase/transposase/recombinase n=1 Tax=Streptomyces sp. NPDC007991 TaxID=3364803 RepID=UPI0036EC6344